VASEVFQLARRKKKQKRRGKKGKEKVDTFARPN